MHTVFVISNIPNPRMNKRMSVALSAGPTALIYWNKGSVEIWKLFHTEIENHEIYVKANYTKPMRRIFPTIKFAFKAIKQVRKFEPEFLYVANIDMLLIAFIYSYIAKRKPKIIYEIADLHTLIGDTHKSLFKNTVKRILINLEKFLCRRIDNLVVTSEKFFENYYIDFVPKTKLIVMPNMPNLKVFENFTKKRQEHFTVGFIGAIRYKKQMKMLISAAEKCNIKIFFAGEGLDNEIKELCKGKNNIEFYGKYAYESEISSLYEKVDCVYSVYDADYNNVRIALPNKLYESIFCELPIIVAKGTYLSEIVEEMGIGISVSHNNEDELVQALVRLSTDPAYYNSIVESCRNNKDYINVEIYNSKLKSVFIKNS